jgi:mono/diheme cytochrome c family protein
VTRKTKIDPTARLWNEQEIFMAISVNGSTIKGLAGAAAALTVAALAGMTIVTTTSEQACAAPRPQTSFAEDVLPIFRGRCFGCHTPGADGEQKSGLDLTTYDGVMKGTKHGPMVIARDPDSSNLMWLLDWSGSAQTRMPHNAKKLSTCDRDAIRAWIREGAKNN